MKILIAYYSRTRLNEKIAYFLQEKIRCDIEKIIDTKDRSSFLNCLFSSFLRQSTTIQPIKYDPQNYDLTIICFPVWAGAPAPAIRAYLEENKDKFKKVIAITSSYSGDKNKAVKTYIEKIISGKLERIIFIKEKDVRNGNYQELLLPFINQLEETSF